MRPPKIPEGAEIVRTFEDFEQHVEAFFEGLYQLFITVGRPGNQKSHNFEKRLGPTSHLIRGWTAPLQAYNDCYHNRNKSLIFDDAEVLWKRPGGRVLLRSLCEHKPQKLLQWASTTRELAKAGIPQRFLTSSRVAIICNRFVFGDTDEYEAIVDRGHLIYFDPPPLEVHKQVATWFWNQEIHDYIGERLHLMDNISVRLYTKAYERMRAGGDWQKLIEEAYCRNGFEQFVQALEVDPACKTVEDRVTKFIEYTHACRATYFNIKRDLKDSEQLNVFERLEIPKLQLDNPPPDEPNVEEEVARAHQEDELAKEDTRENDSEEPDAL
jgi:hypothetical protein